MSKTYKGKKEPSVQRNAHEVNAVQDTSIGMESLGPVRNKNNKRKNNPNRIDWRNLDDEE
jgi:hypothetical protein